jgi:hypothetical protein
VSGNVFAKQESHYSSKYRHPSFYGGLFYVRSTPGTYHNRALVLSFDDKPIEPKPNDPYAPTVPGFYTSYKDRYSFLLIEVIRKKVYFRTQTVNGISYMFVGVAGMHRMNKTDPSPHVPHISGTLTKLKDGRIVETERIKFNHAVIA